MEDVSRGDETALSDLVSLWQRRRTEGREASPAELCPANPELIPALEQRIAALRRMDALVDAVDRTAAGSPARAEHQSATLAHDSATPAQGQAPLDPYATLPTSGMHEPTRLSAEATADWPSLPGYEILGVLGQGGMGVVYRARQRGLNRIVALKMILHAEHASEEARSRFRAEAEAVARLQHPNIVQIYEVGEHKGLPYFSLEFCAGGSLADKLDGTPLPPAEAAQLVQTLAVAMQAAHKAGIVHRDLKPPNVLLSEDGSPKVTDFGLAKKMDAAGQTHTGSILGTPSYMAPEQAGGKTREIGPLTDVYALGAILYELLTGRPPFKAATALDTILQVVHDEPAPPGRLQSHTPKDLETICLKCLQKEPARRYAGAAELAEDLRRFGAGEPIRARPIGALARGWRWARRNPLVAASLAVVALCLLAATGVSSYFGIRAEQARRAEAERAVTEAEAKEDAVQARRVAQRQLLDTSGASGLMAAHEGDHALALLWFARAVQLAADEPEQQELNRIRAANWLRQVSQPEGAFALPGFQQHQDRFRIFQYSPDSKYLLVAAGAGDCLVWDCSRGARVSLPVSAAKSKAAAWEPKTGLLAVARPEGRIQLLSPPEFEPVEEAIGEEGIAVLAFSKDGHRLAWGGTKGARVWDRGKMDYVCPLLVHESRVATLSFGASEELLATSTRDLKARVFRLDTTKGESLFPPVPHTRGEHGLAHGGQDRVAPRFAADDRVLLTVERMNQDRHRLVWRSATNGKVFMAINPPEDQGFLTAFAVSPSGDKVAVFWESKGQLWDARTKGWLGSIVMERRGNWCEDAVFAADGKSLATGGHNMIAQSWSTEEKSNYVFAASSPPVLHPMKVVRVDLSPDGLHLAVALWDGTVYLWRLPEGLPRALSAAAGGITQPVLSPDRRFVMPGGTTYRNGTQLTTRVYRAETLQAAGPVLDPGGILLNAVFSPDGSLVATASSTARTIGERNGRLFLPDGKGGNVQLWDWKSGKRLGEPIAMPAEPRGLAFHPHGHILAVVCADYRIVLVDPAAGTITRALDAGLHTQRSGNANLWRGNGEARFSSDGRYLVTWEMAAPVHVWEPDTGRLLHTLPHDERVEDVAFSPVAPNLLATGGRDSIARVWNLATGEPLARLQHPSHLSRVRFSPEGTELLTGCDDWIFRIWDWRQGRVKSGLTLNDSSLADFDFTADRRWLVTLGLEDVQLTDWRIKTPASPRWRLGKPFRFALKISSEDRRAIVGGFTGSLDAYDLSSMTTPAGGPAEDLLAWAELAAGRKILSQGETIPLSTVEWFGRWRQLRSHRLRPDVSREP